MDDEGDSPPGCEDLFASANVEPKINQVLTYHPTACIGTGQLIYLIKHLLFYMLSKLDVK